MSERSLLIHVHALTGGGAERVCATLARGFRERGWRVILAVDTDHEANQAFADAGIDLRVLGPGHLKGSWRLARLLGRERPDVSLSAMAAANVKHVVAACLAGRSRRAVISFHAFARSEPQRLSRIGYRLLPLLSRLSARTVAVSDDLRRDLVSRWHAVATRAVTLYNPVQVGPDLSRLLTGSEPLILSAGRLVPDKDMLGIVRAFARVNARRPARLAILGEGPERSALLAEAARLGIADRIALPGYLPEPWDYYRRAACFVTASRLESFSMVVVEALAYGLPVVACDSPGPREVLAGGRFGTLVPPGDEVALAEALLDALDRGGNREAAQARGKAFSVSVGVAAYEQMFLSLTPPPA